MKQELLISSVSFLIKGISALYINYIIINYLSTGDFALWAILFSIGILLSVADFGAGQLILSSFTTDNISDFQKNTLYSNSFFLISILSIIVTVFSGFIYYTIEIKINFELFIYVYFIVIFRVFLIPHGAFLQSLGKYYERKFFESASYALSLLYIIYGTNNNYNLFQLLIGMNLFISLSSVAVYFRSNALGSPKISIRYYKYVHLKMVIKKAMPYFMNNTSGLLIYGVFITVSSMFLLTTDLAKLALLHSIIFTNLYQGYELVYRTLQTKLYDTVVFRKLLITVIISFIIWVFFVSQYGNTILSLFFPNYNFTTGELVLYSIYMYMEYIYLLFMSKIQMSDELSHVLLKVSLCKLFVFIVTACFLIIAQPIILFNYFIVLAIASLILTIPFIIINKKEKFIVVIER